MLKQKGSTRYIWQKTLEVLPKLTMTEVNPTEKNGAPALSFVLQANDPKERQANVEIVAEDGKVIGSGSARVGERTELALPQATVVARPTRYEARLTPAAGKPFRVALPGNPLPVRIPYCRDAVSASGRRVAGSRSLCAGDRDFQPPHAQGRGGPSCREAPSGLR